MNLPAASAPSRDVGNCDKTLLRGLIIAAIAATLVAGPATAAFMPPTGLSPGSQYQILFVTADTMAGTSGSESDYNSFVQTEAAPLTALLPNGTTWSAITSTFDGTSYDNAANNVDNDPSLPVYNTQGQLLSFNPFYLWAGPLNANTAVQYDQTGSAVNGFVWTGSVVSGGEPVATTGNALGQANPTYGESNTGSSAWLDAGTAPQGSPLHVYGLSSPIAVVPEPATLLLFGTGLLGLALAGYLRRFQVTVRRSVAP